ncbi:MAG: carboxylate-amine ligase [Anaerolineae bacterium]
MVQQPSLNIGISEEYQIIDPETRELRSIISRVMDSERLILREQDAQGDVLVELPATLEMGTPVCANIKEARQALVQQRRGVMKLAEKRGYVVALAGTHPITSWRTPGIPRPGHIEGLVSGRDMLAQRLLIFGTHVHIGIEDPELCIDVMNVIRYMVPHMLALSTSSPFWSGRNTGLKSYRNVLLENLPRSGIPHHFASWSEYRQYVDMLLATHCIDHERQIYWDLRPHWRLPTLQFRVFDACTTIDEALAVAALVQATVAWLVELRRHNMMFRDYTRSLVAENKWRAVRYGLDGKLVDFGKEQQFSAKQLVRELLRLVDPVVDELGSREELEFAYSIIEQGTSADRQLRIYEENNHDLRAVVDYLIAETRKGLD